MIQQLLICCLLTLLPGCGGTPANPELTMLAPLQRVPLTTEVRRVPAHPHGPDLGNPALYENLPRYLAEGFAEMRVLPGEPHTERTLDGSPPPIRGPNVRRILRFGTMGDFQLMDDESPTRVGFFDDKGKLQAALRPQDAYLCHLANAAVRTMNAIHRMDPLSMVFIGGDTIDNAQSNELEWVLGILHGQQPVECDSGENDDLEPGPSNDPKDPFLPEGLAVPWRWVPGNHDFLIQGNAVVDDVKVEATLSDFAPFGTRNYQLGGRIVQRPIVADARRRPLTPREVRDRISADGDGHGASLAQTTSDSATYSFDVPGTPVRFLVIDTGSRTGGAGAVVRKGDFERYIRPALDSAQAQGKWVISLWDNPISNLGQAEKPLGGDVPDPMTMRDWLREIDRYANLLFSLGRGADQVVGAVNLPSGRAIWELLNAAISDYPQQLRIFELWDGDNGYLFLRATCVDLATDDDPMVKEAQRRAVIDITSTWMGGAGDLDGRRNVDLWIRKP